MDLLALFTRSKSVLQAVLIAGIVAGLVYGVHLFRERDRESGRQEIRAAWDAQKLLDAQAAARQRALWDAQRKTAEDERKLDETRLQALADALGTTADRLRHTIAARRADLGRPAAAAGAATSDTALAVFGECAEAYGALATAADGHVADIRSLERAWPQ